MTPEFGSLQVTAISRHDVGKFLAGKVPQGYSRSSMKGMLTSLSTVLEYAVSCDVLEKNPCKGVKLPRPINPEKTRRVLAPEEVTKIAGKLKEPYATLFVFLAITGLRIGEACGIRWSAIDANGVLHVCQKVYEGRVGLLKTRSSERSLPLPPEFLARLKALGTKDWVFASRVGTPINAGNVLKRFIHPAAAELGITLTGWHDLRHSATTKMIREGFSPKTVSRIMGHSNLSITLGIYDHPDIADFRAPLNEMANQSL